MEEDYDEIYGNDAPQAPSPPAAPLDWQLQQPVPALRNAQLHAGRPLGPPQGEPPGPTGGDADFAALFGGSNVGDGSGAGPAGPVQADGRPEADDEDDNDDDDFAVRLDTHDSGPPAPPQSSTVSGTAGGPPGFRGGFVPRPSLAPQRPFMPSGGRGEARPYLDATSATAQAGAPVWASGSGGRGGGGSGGRGMGTRQWRPQFVPLGATALEVDDTVAFPEAAKSGQLIKLPGQNRVTADEYQEFTTLGQGGIFDLDLDRVVDAPWRQGYDVTDFFNYGLNPGRWKAYAREVQQACAQLRLQEAVVLYNPSLAPLSADLDLPPELKTTLMAKGLINSSAPAFRSPTPVPAQARMPRAAAPDSTIHLAGPVLPA